MALSIQTDTITQANDSTVLRVTDGTGIYDATTNPGGWGSPNPAVTVIDGTTYHLELDVVITTSDGTETTYDTIDLYTKFGPFTTVNDLVFDINASMLISGGTAVGTDEDQLPDGWYVLTYSFTDDGSTYTNSTITTKIFVDGVVRQKIYDELREVPYSTDWQIFNHDYKEWYDIIYPLYFEGWRVGTTAEISEARKSNVLTNWANLESQLNQRL